MATWHALGMGAAVATREFLEISSEGASTFPMSAEPGREITKKEWRKTTAKMAKIIFPDWGRVDSIEGETDAGLFKAASGEGRF